MELSPEQQIAFDKYIQGKNIFITGPGGTGKSTLIKKIQADARKKQLNIQVCALTGCAAVLIGCKAKTIHSWSGIGLGNGSIGINVKKVTLNKYKVKAWKNIDILVIDEVSMMSQKIFEMLDAIGKTARDNTRPFGGIQIIFLGDFYQLPPVGNKDEIDTVRFCFESPLWNEIFKNENTVQLKKIFRQTDEVYTKILNQIREGRIKKSSNDLLLSLVGKKPEEGSIIQPTKLFPIRSKADSINESKMKELDSPEFEFKIRMLKNLPTEEKEKAFEKEKGHPIPKFTPEQIDAELNNIHNSILCNDVVKLKVGAQVMCVVNIELPTGGMICNGSQGVVVKFSEQGLPIVKYRNGYEMTMTYHVWESENILGAGVSQIPLILAWAITIHKSQGATMDVAEIDVGSGIFECGQTYVALSRVKSLEGLYLSSFDASKIFINKKVREFYDNLSPIITK
jgi:ATP-dependent DNA helicase PIF1